MLDPAKIPPVDSQENLARFIVASSHVRKSDNTVKPDAFIPYSHVELSVTRHIEATESELWQEGARIASIRQTGLHGRADVLASDCLAEELSVEARPITENPNHADVVGWPAEKAAQKMKALVIARKALFRSPPAV